MGNRKKIRKPVEREKVFDGGGANRKAINSHVDVDSEDEFEVAQDKILIDGQTRDRRGADGDMEASDEEVLALSGVDSEEEEDVDDSDESDVEEFGEETLEEGWGDRKREYYDADDLTDEEDLKAEEQEALRIQKRNLAKLDASAYVDEFDDWKDDAEEETGTTIETLPTTIPEDLPKSELIKILHTRNPEFAPFALEFQTLHQDLEHLDSLSQRKHHPQHEIINAKANALRSYLAVLAFYFALMSSEQAQTTNIKEHEIMISLVRCRQAWQRVQPVLVSEDLSDIITEPLPKVAQVEVVHKPRKRKRSSKITTATPSVPVKESYAPDQDDDLEETFKALKSIPKKRKTQSIPDLADNVADAVEAEDSAARRKTLQFYASQIYNKSAKRNAAAQSGDLDIPYRERRKEREMRLQAEAERRKGGTAGADLDDEPTTGHAENKSDSDDEYYQLIASASAQQKATRKQDHDDAVAAVRAERAGFALPETVNGKRKIGRDIAANKGLTVSRPKENRNARVKKRNKYEAAKKKLGSQKAIFKQPTGSYGGENSGINARVIKSTKLDQGSKKKR